MRLATCSINHLWCQRFLYHTYMYLSIYICTNTTNHHPTQGPDELKTKRHTLTSCLNTLTSFHVELQAITAYVARSRSVLTASYPRKQTRVALREAGPDPTPNCGATGARLRATRPADLSYSRLSHSMKYTTTGAYLPPAHRKCRARRCGCETIKLYTGNMRSAFRR